MPEGDAREEAITIEENGRVKAVVKVDPAIAERTIFMQIPQQVVEDEKINEILQKLFELEAGPEQVAAIIHSMMREMVGTLLGQIIPPRSGALIIRDRMVQTAVILLEMLREEIERAQEEIEQALREGKEYEVASKVRRLVQIHHASLIAIREIMNRMLVLYHLNLPANLRPPLAQVKLGMELIG